MSGWAASAALYRCEVRHTRRTPTRYALRHRTYLWFVDLDDPPRPPWYLRPLAGFRAAARRRDVDAFLEEHGLDPHGLSVRTLAHARVLGYAFNPLTVHWCRDADARPVAVIAEVHNTYGGRHRYLLHPDPTGRDRTAKKFYVSPFFPVAGDYELRLPEPGDRLSLTVHLDLGESRAFTATLTGTREPAGTAALLRAVLRRPFSTAAVSLAIRLHGVRLWLRGLPVAPRTTHPRKDDRDRADHH